MAAKTRLGIFRDARLAGMTAEEVFQMIIDASREHTGPHAGAENVLNELDALDCIEKVWGKRARRRCDKMIGLGKPAAAASKPAADPAKCPHCFSSAPRVFCAKCNRDMCDDCISSGPRGERVCGSCCDDLKKGGRR